LSKELDIEAKLIESKDNLQIQYLQDYTYTKNEIMIVDDTPLIMTIQKYLTKAGFQNTYLCKTVKEGTEIFTKFVKMGKLIPIILNDSIDKNIEGVINQFLSIDSGASIIVETASDKSEPGIKDLFNLGIFSIISKPIRFSDVQELVKTLESEHGINKNEIADLKNKMENVFRNTKRISAKHVSELVEKEITIVDEQLKNLESHGKVVSLGKINELACNQCNSIRINQVAKCPQCKAIEFRQQNLVEHYKCGEVYPKPAELDKCPKCNKKLGNLGKDYGELDNFYVCSACNDKFPDPEYEFECRNCESKFEKHQVNWIKSMNYKIIK
jgi:response regulator of citrate/malate metabolism